MRDKFGVLFLGDVVGRTGRRAMDKFLPGLVKKHAPSMIIANGENAAGGSGITEDIGKELFLQVDVLTSGNHIWDKKEALPYLEPGAAAPAAGQLSRRSTPAARPTSSSGPTGSRPRSSTSRAGSSWSPWTARSGGPTRRSRPWPRRDARSSSSISTPRRHPRSRPWAGTSTAGSRPSSARTPTSRRRTSGSCRRARPTSPTSAWPAAATPSSASPGSRPCRGS